MGKRVLFVAPVPRFSMRNAEAFGSIEFLFADITDANPMNGQATIARMVSRLQAINFDETNDTIALTGPVAIVAMFLLAAGELSQDGVTILVFDARNGGEYRPRRLELCNV